MRAVISASPSAAYIGRIHQPGARSVAQAYVESRAG